MYMLSLECVRGWAAVNNRWAPISLSIYCPFCTALATFTLATHSFDQHRNTISATGTCPACSERVRAWVLDPATSQNNNDRTCAGLWIYPQPANNTRLMDGAERLPEEIRREYTSARNVFGCGEWNATALCCRRALEAIAQNLLPANQRKGSLSKQLEHLSSTPDLAKPLKSLADTLRKGGNLGAHFNEGGQPDKATAQQMIEFIEYLLRYLFILPGEVEAFHNEIMTSQAEVNTPGNAPQS